jgi:hypothetical protein
MATNSLGRKSRFHWRVVLGLSFLGFLIIASASHAETRVRASSDVTALDANAGSSLTP